LIAHQLRRYPAEVKTTHGEVGGRRPRTLVLLAVVVSLSLVAFSAPTAAQAAWIQYALHYPLHEVEIKYSAVGTVRGGKAWVDSTIMRTYIQTVSGGYLLASSYSDDGATVNIAHVTYSGAQSRCYWDYIGGAVAGNPTVGATCQRNN